MESDARGAKPCKTCTDFKTWSFQNKQRIGTAQDDNEKESMSTPTASPVNENASASHRECPVDKDELGRSSWNLLHTIAAFYPDEPSEVEKKRTEDFLKMFSLMYPCEVCAGDFQKQLERFPPKTESQTELTQWLCRAHNRINLRLGKPLFDCARVNERWRDGWTDGSCD